MGNKKSNGTNIELENNGNKLLDVVTTTSDQEEEQMTSAHQHQQRHPFGIGNFRTYVIWFFLIMSMLYILYSSNLRLTNDTPLKCSTSLLSLTNISTKENLLFPSPNTSRSLEPPPPQESQQKLNQTITLPQTISPPQTLIQKVQRYDDTLELKHIVFGIAASSNLWEQRKKYIKLWWKPNETRGSVWLEKNVRTYQNEGLPDIRISSDTYKFPYTNRQGKRSALRLSRIVSEMLRLGVEDVRWFVMGDDDTVFMVDNLVRVLSKYDHTQFYYVGSSSESHVQNIYFSYSMAYGGGGFAISYPLAKELEKMQDRCIQRYPGLYGSDDRIQACMSELGVPLTKETGFHQYDVYGDLLGLLAAHPITPLLSLHHLDVVDPIFPGMNRVNALQRLFQSVKLDSASIMQQSICYDKKRYWSISVSWGYVVQILRGVVSPRELEMPTRTFLNWYRRADYTGYAFNTRPVTKQPCQKPYIFYMSMARYDEARRQTVGYYSRHGSKHPTCRWKMESPEKIDSVVVLKRPDNLRWRKSPRRDCCRILPSNKKSTMYIWVGNCREDANNRNQFEIEYTWIREPPEYEQAKQHNDRNEMHPLLRHSGSRSVPPSDARTRLVDRKITGAINPPPWRVSHRSQLHYVDRVLVGSSI